MKSDPLTKQQTWSQIGLAVFFIGSLLVGLAGSFMQRDPMPNFREQRALAPFPAIDGIGSLHRLPAAITKFSADNFGMRKPLISTYFGFRLNVLQADLGLPAVIGDEGWLFIEEEIASFRRQDILTAAQRERIRSRLDAWCEYAHERGAELVFFVGPNKSTIYQEKMPPAMTVFSQNPSLLDQVNAIDYRCRFIKADLRDTLLKHRDEQLYYKWGTHWNDRAAQLSWLRIKELAAAASPDLRWPAVHSTLSYRPAKPLEDSMWQWFGQDDPYTVMLPQLHAGGMAGLRRVSQTETGRARMLVFGDSFLTFMRATVNVVANDYSGWLLAPGEKFTYRPEDLAKDAWLITAGVNERKLEIMDLMKPKLVMLEVVERNILSIAELPMPGAGAADERASFYVTDVNWVKGVARNWAGFFVPNNPAAIARYAPGRVVQFADGRQRTITRQEPKGAYLNVFVSGEPLDGEKTGYPDTITVLNTAPAEPKRNE